MIAAIVLMTLCSPVQDANELTAALKQLTTQDVTVEIEGTIPLPEGLPIVKGQTYNLTMIGGTLDFDRCKPDGYPVRSKSLTMIGVTISDYEGNSQAIDLQDVQAATFLNCSFRRIARVVQAPLKTPTTQASDTVYPQAIGGWGGNAEIVITGCAFEDVGGAQVRWSHPIYLHEKNVTIANCVFTRCGGGVNITTTDRPVLFVGNLWQDAVRGNESYTTWEYPDWWYSGQHIPAVVVGDTITGPVRWVWSGYTDRVVQVGNDWSKAQPTQGVYWPNAATKPEGEK
jgi:hypothetical protein